MREQPENDLTDEAMEWVLAASTLEEADMRLSLLLLERGYWMPDWDRLYGDPGSSD